ncbi:MAG: polysaccharide pyruvyl transferase family protein [Vreelandella alkaliphila]|uniref:polysaccharide pyruvyl transferase family protein n=1 Tax=Vreelandella alkaliphila TaxID=272774 RepID=UPI003F99B8F1
MFSLSGLNVNDLEFPQDIESFRKHFSLNSGNLLFHYAAEKIIDFKGAKRYSWKLEGASLENGCSGIVLPMANHLGRHVDLSKAGPPLDNLSVPAVVLGLGAQFERFDMSFAKHIPAGTVDWLNKVKSADPSIKNIAVRGMFTYRLLKKLGLGESVEALGCQSNFISSKKRLGYDIYKKYKASSFSEIENGISVTAGDYTKKKFSTLERSLIALIEGKEGRYIVQNPKSLIQLASGWGDQVDQKIKDDVKEEMLPSVTDIDSWFKHHAAIYVSVPQWLFDLSKKNFVVGTRIHGIQAALQAGTPALCLCIDSRTTELCEMMAIPHVDAQKYINGISLKECVDELESWDYQEYDRKRLVLARKMKRFLLNNSVKPSDHLIALTN